MACKKAGTTEQNYYRWRQEYGGLRVDQAKRLKQLETENGWRFTSVRDKDKQLERCSL